FILQLHVIVEIEFVLTIFVFALYLTPTVLEEKRRSSEVFLQDPNNALMLLELNMQLASPLFAQSPIALQRKLGEKMHSSEWVFQLPLLRGVNVELLNRNPWQQFYENNTEMIITKSGRRMFPSVQINVNGLEKRENYYVLMEIAPTSDRRHKREQQYMGGWSFAGPAEPQLSFGYRIYKHPESLATGSHWMDNPISFNKLKLTNNTSTTPIITIWIVRCFDAKNYDELFTHSTALFAFKKTEFIAVTAYQNENITKLKINNNPFAKGFRQLGSIGFQSRRKSLIDLRLRIESAERPSLKGSKPIKIIFYFSRGVEVGRPCHVGEADANPATVASRSPAPGELKTQCPRIRCHNIYKEEEKQRRLLGATATRGMSLVRQEAAYYRGASYGVTGYLRTNRVINLASCVQCPDHPRTLAFPENRALPWLRNSLAVLGPVSLQALKGAVRSPLTPLGYCRTRWPADIRSCDRAVLNRDSPIAAVQRDHWEVGA
ncbi:Uncharacterized protein DBV15_06758, partial [Temnothorax longispinosus]